MFLPRLIPILLLKGKGLVKTVRFRHPRYVGDPINTVKIFNDLKADELVFVDITASRENRTISHGLIRAIGDEAFMPFAAGGGIRSLEQIEHTLKAGAEKVVINTQAALKPKLVEEAAKHFGSQSVLVSIDVKKTLFGKQVVMIKDGFERSDYGPVEWAKRVESLGAGEIMINSIDRDGMMQGYDLELIRNIADQVGIPVIACGGAGCLEHLKEAYYQGHAHALAAGSMFVFHGPRRAVLINYPSKMMITTLFESGTTEQ
jgi:cyclase